MKCPYCAEEIKDEAVVCRHCDHDFSIVKPLLLRVIGLEKDFESLSSASASPAQSAEEASLPLTVVLSTLLGFVLTSGYLFLSIAPPLRETPAAKILAIVLPPAVLGLAAGFSWGDREWKTYLYCGLALGILDFLCTWFMISRFEDLRFRWAWAFCVFVVGQTSTFTFAAFFGKALRSRWTPKIKRRSGDTAGLDKTVAKAAPLVELLMKVSLLATSIAGNIALADKYFGG